MKKIFFYQDTSGRGFSCQVAQENLPENEYNEDDTSLRLWAKHAEIGETWQSDTDKYTRIS